METDDDASNFDEQFTAEDPYDEKSPVNRRRIIHDNEFENFSYAFDEDTVLSTTVAQNDALDEVNEEEHEEEHDDNVDAQ